MQAVRGCHGILPSDVVVGELLACTYELLFSPAVQGAALLDLLVVAAQAPSLRKLRNSATTAPDEGAAMREEYSASLCQPVSLSPTF